jgi:hypothetical protein
MVPRVLQE